jgi:tetratricopeptide (TPR) repeat protein
MAGPVKDAGSGARNYPPSTEEAPQEPVYHACTAIGHEPQTLLQAEAVRLFVERSTAALPTFLLTPENATAVAQICRRLGDKRGVAHALEGLGWVAFAQCAHKQALVRFSESLALFQELASKPEIAGVLNGLGELARSQGDYEQARARYEEYLALCRELNIKMGKAYALHNLGLLALHRGDLEWARACFDESMALCHALGHKSGIAYCLAGLAGVISAVGQPEQAARLFGAVEALLESTGTHLVPTDRAEYDRNVAMARSQLEDTVFTAAWVEGRSLPLDEVIAEARRSCSTGGSATTLWCQRRGWLSMEV